MELQYPQSNVIENIVGVAGVGFLAFSSFFLVFKIFGFMTNKSRDYHLNADDIVGYAPILEDSS